MADHPKSLDAWSGEFGDRYTQRSGASAEAVRGRARVWGEVLRRMTGDMPRSVLEVGPNVGLNLLGIQALSDMEQWAIEPNASA
ncbi:MAG TPA: methyltransferase type 11, partial [Caulobacter sp.]|nr:methyltransferase type 11 [Caulobacter sp.]